MVGTRLPTALRRAGRKVGDGAGSTTRGSVQDSREVCGIGPHLGGVLRSTGENKILQRMQPGWRLSRRQPWRLPSLGRQPASSGTQRAQALHDLRRVRRGACTLRSRSWRRRTRSAFVRSTSGFLRSTRKPKATLKLGTRSLFTSGYVRSSKCPKQKKGAPCLPSPALDSARGRGGLGK